MDPTKSTPPQSAASTSADLQFADYHAPSLKSGVYRIEVTQAIAADGIPAGEQFSTSQRFAVQGERFRLTPDAIHAVFPPAGSIGDHGTVLPHVILNRTTLPWERIAARDAPIEEVPAAPWLALLVFDEAEKPEPKLCTLAELQEATDGWPGVAREPGQEAEDQVTVIEVARSLFERLVPSIEALRYLAHVRRQVDAGGALVGSERAVVLGSRLPSPSGVSVAHLVSVEERYVRRTGAEAFVFDTGAGSDGAIRLVSLASWRFACVTPKASFMGLLVHLDKEPSTLRLPPPPAAQSAPAGKDAANLQQASARAAEALLRRGYVPCSHLLRAGERTVSWYHGPLTPLRDAPADVAAIASVKLADALVRYHEDHGMFDVSYAAAWELGRLLALDSGVMSVALYRWKHAHARFTHAGAALVEAHLPTSPAAALTPSLPAAASTWLEGARLLQGIPFDYLVPDERLLPIESIRFFQIDARWIACLFAGALSLGGPASASAAQQAQEEIERLSSGAGRPVSGFLLRSAVVAGFPAMTVDGYCLAGGEVGDPDRTFPDEARATLLRMDRLSPSVLLCLFSAAVDVVVFHLPPEVVHAGLLVDPETSLLSKRLRRGDGEETQVKLDAIPWRGEEASRVVDVDALVASIAAKAPALGLDTPIAPAMFGLQMLEGAPRVRFLIARED
ncbi:hypothetical protein [Chondromyces apiculatus]|uniref:Uncharacterized protein n=1 Tax=Chondromyces apiculatus DSM 436 TaxID=1192034 RepID=A0A017T4B4_9BACT|nr:hypothetical protein [Chondromyces apiculatus]EYF03650.1 Hypothetical protein CAP_5261 [Chondromyces apiculatus DSM 436]